MALLPFFLCAIVIIPSLCHGYRHDSDNSLDMLNDILDDMITDKKEAMIEKRSDDFDAKTSDSQENISMPGVSPKKHDSYICYGQKVPRDEYYVGFKPKAEMQTAHHMLLFGCEEPAEMGKAWNCGEMIPVCRSGAQHILYAWGKNAPPLTLPKGVGFKVGPSTPIKYLVLQVHYGKVDKFIGTNLKDYSGVSLNATGERLRYRAGIFILAEGGSVIPPHKPIWHLDTGCVYDHEVELHPFAVRVHAHKLATVISGYRVRNGKWKLIHKESPQKPQAFYYLEQPMSIRKGDHLEGRCTYNSMKKDVVTKIGATMNDEMCNFYMMYFYDSKKYKVEPPSMCNWGSLDDHVKYPVGSDKLDSNVANPEKPSAASKDAPLYKAMPEWSSRNKFGQVSGVAVDQKGFVVVFHRADRTWNGSTFNDDNTLKGNPGPIKENTLAWLDQKTGKIIFAWGKNTFYLPHGLTVDHAGNLWLTDVGLHQVFKYNLMKSKKPLLTLGKRGVPGKDVGSFCKPTDVAVDRTGVFYVSDGYCNSRILVFSPKGQLLLQITNEALRKSALAAPHSFHIPHSVSLDEKNQLLYVADRENGRILVFNALVGTLSHSISGFGTTVYAITYQDGYIHAVSGPPSAKGFTYNVKTKELVSWGTFGRPHDLAVSKSGRNMYVAEIGPNRVSKLQKST